MALRVLTFGWEWPPYNSGGLGTACEGLTRALLEKGLEIIFVLPKRFDLQIDQPKIVFAEIENLLTRRVPSLLYPYVTSGAYKIALNELGLNGCLYGNSLIEEAKLYAWRAKRIAREENFDLIHAHDWLSFLAGLMAKKTSGKPLIIHVHATEFDRTGGNSINQEVYEIERLGMQRADKIIAVSNWTKNIIVNNYGVPPEKVSVVHNGVSDAARPAGVSGGLKRLKEAGNKIVLFVGRITLQKGPDYFVRVAKKVLEFEPKVYFMMVGAGDMLPQVMETAAYCGIADRVIFTGFLRGAELDEVYQAADLYVLPSVSEPFGITPLEALVQGTPVIVSKQSGVSEVLNHALKVDFWDIDEMTNKIVSVLRYPPLHKTLALQGQQEVGRITWPEAARKCLDIYRQLVPV